MHNDILSVSVKASNLAALAIAVTEYEGQNPAGFQNIDGKAIKISLVNLLNENMQQLREEINEAKLPGNYHHALSAACGATAALENLAYDAEDDADLFDDLCSFCYSVVDIVSRLAVELDELCLRRDEE